VKVEQSKLSGVLIIQPRIYRDSRGFFLESFNARSFREATGVDAPFVQDNHSRSRRNVLRGLHYQLPRAQGKLVRVVSGEIYDVAVDLRRSSPSYGQWFGLRLSAQDHRQLWIPPGCAHGFLVLSDIVDMLYKTTDYYTPDCEHCVRWDDPALAIDWPLSGAPLLSAKDANSRCLADVPAFD